MTYDCKQYKVSRYGESARINMIAMDRPERGGVHYSGEILIISTFGTWSRFWKPCTEPFQQFLLSVGFDDLCDNLTELVPPKYGATRGRQRNATKYLPVTKHNAKAKRIWRELWPEFTAALRADMPN